MSKKKKLLDRPNYLLTRYQNEIYRQLVEYMEKNKLSQRDVAKALNVSDAYISQVLHGEFNFTLKKLIELALFIGKAPMLSFVDKDEYWLLREKGQHNVSFTLSVERLSEPQLHNIKAATKKTSESARATITLGNEPIKMNDVCLQ